MDLSAEGNDTQQLIQLYRKQLHRLAKVSLCTRQELLLIFQFCDCDLDLAELALRKLGADSSPTLRQWLERPSLADQYLNDLKSPQSKTPHKEAPDQLLSLTKDVMFTVAEFLCPF